MLRDLNNRDTQRDRHGNRLRTSAGLILKTVRALDSTTEEHAAKIIEHLQELENSPSINDELRIKVIAARTKMIELAIKAAAEMRASEQAEEGAASGEVTIRVVRDKPRNEHDETGDD